ncbi:hypothetical protein [Bradyrhizobium tropiciagri]|uniref:hypothetical protein n=1 Tax=Bradyrhizobium tropiciagri TaxID=312253 RepID=UPI001009D4D8|nr:hypothetical protein [Bradyrhizobium tropiciagri]
MVIQNVMDHTGHSRHEFDAHDIEALAEAERRFRELTSEGYVAAVRTVEGESSRVFAFDPTAKETLFFRRLRGG